MNVDKNDLDRWAAACHQAHDAVALALALIHHGDTLQAQELLQSAKSASWGAYRRLVDVGAEPVEGDGVVAAVPLHLLDTPATRRLLEALRTATDAAAAVDQERGWTLKDGTPCGWGGTLAGMTERLRVEVDGPRGRGEN